MSFNKFIPQSINQIQSQGSTSMITAFKNKIQYFLPSSIKEPVNKLLDILDKSFQIKSQPVETMNELKRILNNIANFIKDQIKTINLTGNSKNLVTSFFESLLALILILGIIKSNTKGGLKSRKGLTNKKHKKTRRH